MGKMVIEKTRVNGGIFIMEVFIGRQPIFNRNHELFAYELLYRSGNDNIYNSLNHDVATAEVIANGFYTFGIEKLANNKKCFINFTENLLYKEVPTLFSPDQIVVEILEDIKATDENLKVIQLLKNKGYTIALDDFIEDEQNRNFIELADIIKVDFLQSTDNQKREIVKKYRNLPIKFLAEKVETIEEYQQALSWGYDYFQGYYFSKPIILSSTDILPLDHNYILILNELSHEYPDVIKVSKMIEQDLALTYKLLKLTNSASFQIKNEIKSVQQAIMLLGLNEIKKWLTVLLLANSHNKQVSEVLKLSLVRAKFAEKIALQRKVPTSEYFLFGMFSLIDTLLHRPINEILSELPLSINIKNGLTLKDPTYTTLLKLINSVEKAEFNEMESFCNDLSLAKGNVVDDYYQAIEWTNHVIREIEAIAN